MSGLLSILAGIVIGCAIVLIALSGKCPDAVQHFIGIRRLTKNEIIPRGWGIFYSSDYRQVRVIAPWGLNLLYALARAGYMQVKGWIPLRLSDWTERKWGKKP